MVSQTLEARYWSYVDKRGPDECWLWTASTNKGYGQVWVGGKRRVEQAHRIAWLLAYNESPGLLIRHRCDNPLCQNPNHLELGTHADNTQDMMDRGRYAKHQGENNPRAKLTRNDIVTIRAMREAGMTQRAIGENFGVARTTIAGVLQGKKWNTC